MKVCSQLNVYVNLRPNKIIYRNDQKKRKEKRKDKDKEKRKKNQGYEHGQLKAR